MNEEPTESEEINEESDTFTPTFSPLLLEKVESENHFLRERIQFLEQALDQEQKLNAIGQRNVEKLSNQIEVHLCS